MAATIAVAARGFVGRYGDPPWPAERPARAPRRPRGRAAVVPADEDALPAGRSVMLKLSPPVVPDHYLPLVEHTATVRVVALSGGYSRPEACAELAKNRGMIASFSRALLEDLRADMSDEVFDAALGEAIDEIYSASIT